MKHFYHYSACFLREWFHTEVLNKYIIMPQPKPNQQEKISFKVSEIREYFPHDYTASQMTRDILKGLELLLQQRQRNRDAR